MEDSVAEKCKIRGGRVGDREKKASKNEIKERASTIGIAIGNGKCKHSENITKFTPQLVTLYKNYIKNREKPSMSAK